MKKNNIFLFLSFLLLLLPLHVNGADICSSTKYNKLKREAFNTELKYDLKFDESHKSYFIVTVYNVSNNLMIKYNGSILVPDEENKIVIPTFFDGGKTYEIKFYGGYKTSCIEEYIYSKKIAIPKYNVYSERDECIEYEEFKLCNKFYAGEIQNDTEFEQKLEEYKKSIAKKPPVELEKEKNIFEKIIEFYMDNIIITGPITIVLAVGLVIYVVIRLIRRKKRIKLDF